MEYQEGETQVMNRSEMISGYFDEQTSMETLAPNSELARECGLIDYKSPSVQGEVFLGLVKGALIDLETRGVQSVIFRRVIPVNEKFLTTQIFGFSQKEPNKSAQLVRIFMKIRHKLEDESKIKEIPGDLDDFARMGIR